MKVFCPKLAPLFYLVLTIASVNLWLMPRALARRCPDSRRDLINQVSGKGHIAPQSPLPRESFDTLVKKHFNSVDESTLVENTTPPPEPKKLELWKRVREVELKKGGKIISSPQEFSHLEDGIYSYLISTQGHIVIIPRAAVLKYGEILNLGARYLGTHRSMMNHLREVTGNPHIKVAAAGEFEKSVGLTNQFNNKSGSYRGGSKHLALAHDHLKANGLDFSENTFFYDYSVSGKDPFDVHIDAIRDADNRIKIFNSPMLKAQSDRCDQIRREIVALFPSDVPASSANPVNGPGKINIDQLKEAIYDHHEKIFNHHLDPVDALSDFGQTSFNFKEWFIPGESYPLTLIKAFNKGGIEEVKKSVDLMEKVVEYFKAHPPAKP